MIEKQVRYNVKVDTHESEFSANRWTFMIIDSEYGIKNLEREIYSQFEIIIEPRILYVCTADSSRHLYSKFFSFSTSEGKIKQPDKIHSTLTLDEDLTEQNDVCLEKFLKEIIKGKR